MDGFRPSELSEPRPHLANFVGHDEWGRDIRV